MVSWWRVRNVSMASFLSSTRAVSQFHLLVVLPFVSRLDSCALKSPPAIPKRKLLEEAVHGPFELSSTWGLCVHRD